MDALPPGVAQVANFPQIFHNALADVGALLVTQDIITNEQWSDATTQYQQENNLYDAELYHWMEGIAIPAGFNIAQNVLAYYTQAISGGGGRSKRRRSKKKRSKKKHSKKKRSKKRRKRKY